MELYYGFHASLTIHQLFERVAIASSLLLMGSRRNVKCAWATKMAAALARHAVLTLFFQAAALVASTTC